MTSRRRTAVAVAVAGVLALLLYLFWSHGRGGADGGSAAKPGAGSATDPIAARTHGRLPLRFRSRQARLSLRGRVVDTAGQAIAGAAVRLSGVEERAATSADDGRFAFDDLAAGDYFASASAAGRASAPKQVHLRLHTPPVTLRLFAAATLEVSVVTLDGDNPIPGAQVYVLPDPGLGDEPLREGVTDEHGVAKLAALTPASYGIVASAPGYAYVQQPMPPQAGLTWRVTMKLLRGAPVRGVVIAEDGTPVKGAAVIPQPASLISVYSPRPRVTKHVTLTDEHGEFTLPALEEGEFVLRATHPSYLPGQSKVINVDGVHSQSGVRIVVDRGATIAGRVVDANGGPEPFATVRVNADDPSVKNAGLRTTRADEAGHFRIDGLPGVPVELVASSLDASSTNVAFDLSEKPQNLDAEIRLELDGVIEGTVTDGDGAPIADAQVVCVGHKIGAIGLRPVTPETTDDQGRFACTGLAPGEYGLTARRPYANNNQSPWMRSVGTTANTGEPVTLVLPGDGGIAGQVKLSDGSVPSEFEVSVDDSGAPRRFQTEDGRFLLDGLSPRQYTLQVNVGEHRTSVDVGVPEGGTANVGVIQIDAY